MIVTRRRKKRIPWRRYALPLALVAIVVALLSFAPTRAWIASGPLAPAMKPVSATFDAAGREREIGSQNAQIADLQTQLVDARSQITERDKQISSLQTQLNDAQQQAAAAHAATPQKPADSSAQAGAQTVKQTSDLSTSATPEMRRTATVWAAMDSEAAAKIVQRLPQDYVARVFAVMSPDAVGAILENLPSAYAARLTQEHPELQR